MTHRVLAVPAPGPNLMILHSAGTTPEQMAALVGPVEGFNVIYPEAAKDLRWDHLGDADGSWLAGLGPCDFICGYSSGAFMASRMMRDVQYKGGMMVAGGLLKSYAGSWQRPCPVMLINGTADTRVPFNGSTFVLGAQATTLTFLRATNAPADAVRKKIPDTKAADGCHAYFDDWSGKVRLYTVVQGGHTWPGTKWRDPKGLLGNTCMDFSATEAMRQFFANR